jgi:hypothetical protein
MQTHPRIVHGMPNEEYHKHPAISSSQLVTAVDKSMAHFWLGWQQNPNAKKPNPTDAMRIGTAVHTYLLEPLSFRARYLIHPEDAPRRPTKAQINAATKSPASIASIEYWNKVEADEASGKVVYVSHDELELLEAMSDALAKQKITFEGAPTISLADLLKQGVAEESFFWIEKETGLELRVRTDWRIDLPNLGLIVDYKTTRCAQKNWFGRDAASMYYWMRAAMYIDGVKAATGRKYDYILLAQEKEAPYLAAAYHYPDHLIDLGRELYRDTLVQIKKCQEAGEWPGYSNALQALDIPSYVINRHDNLAAIAAGEVTPMYGE